jgi:hypothetical protein
MGTRHLINVKIDNNLKVAQYGQWDGYPTGQGVSITRFLKTMDEPLFRERLKALHWWDEVDELHYTENLRKTFPEQVGDTFVTLEVDDWIKETYPELSRNTAANILSLIQNGSVTTVVDQRDFEDDTLFCEYVYLIDMDKRCVHINGCAGIPFAEFTEEKMQQVENEENGID